MAKKTKIYIDENIPFLAESLEGNAEVISFNGRKLKNSHLKKTGCDALIVRSTADVNEALLDGIDVKLVGTATSGIEHIDLEYLKNRKIKFASSEGANANSVAEYVIYNILRWAEFNEIDLHDKFIGIIGYGNIGKIVAEYAYSLGLRVLLNDPPLMDAGVAFPEKFQYSELEDLLRDSDIITNHVPLIKTGKYKTLHLLNKSNIKLINEDSLILQTSRGGVIDETAIIDLYKNIDVSFAVDVWSEEPVFNSELAKLSVFTTPHIAGYSLNGKINGAKMMADAIAKVLKVKPDYSVFNIDDSKKISNNDDKIFKDYEELLKLIETSRDFSNDNENFRTLLNLPNTKKSKEFDLLRKNYPKRTEILSL